MTPKQAQIYAMLLEAKSYKEISRELNISKETVKTHCRSIYRLYDVKNRSELIACVLNNKIMGHPVCAKLNRKENGRENPLPERHSEPLGPRVMSRYPSKY